MFLMLTRTFPETLSFPSTARGHDDMIIRGTRASAGTLSPTRTSRMSPGTTSSASMPRVQLGWRDVERLQRCGSSIPRSNPFPTWNSPRNQGLVKQAIYTSTVRDDPPIIPSKVKRRHETPWNSPLSFWCWEFPTV